MKWEYKIISFYSYSGEKYSIEKYLEEVGREGWELVCINGCDFYFKRALNSNG